MSPKIEAILRLLDDDKAWNSWLCSNGYDRREAPALAFHLRDECANDPDSNWEKACETVCNHCLHVEDVIKTHGWGYDTIECEILRGDPVQWIVTALIAQELPKEAKT